ncbi:MAG: hypothetical protein RIB58_13065 [Phycisphaerales bacterium]
MGTLATQSLFVEPSLIDTPPGRFGAVPMRTPAEFMQVAPSPADGGWAYEGERAGYHGWTHINERLTRGEDLGGSPHPHRWWRLEFKAADGDLPHPAWLVLAGHPYAGGWVHGMAADAEKGPAAMRGTTRFKPGSKKGPDQRPDITSRPFKDAREAIRWVESHEHDYWDRDPRRLTAGVPEPALPMAPNPNSRVAWKHELMVMGVCEDPAACHHALLHSDKARKLIDMTVAGTLRPFFRSPENPSLGELRLRDELRDPATAVTTLHLAIQQAMAGPHKDSEAWLGRPLIEKVDHIYCGHMNNLNRAGGG